MYAVPVSQAEDGVQVREAVPVDAGGLLPVSVVRGLTEDLLRLGFFAVYGRVRRTIKYSENI